MKKFSFILTMLLALVGMQANASIYIVGSAPFGGWDPANGVEMTDNGNGTYTYTATLESASVWFVFSDGLDSNWDTFNSEYRYGPTTGSDQTIAVDTDVTTQKQGNGSGSYKFTGTKGNSYTITFDLNNLSFKISGKVDDVTETTYTVAGSLTEILGTTWDVNNTDNDMVKGSDGIYTLSKTGIEITSGTVFEFKIAVNHDWGTAYPSSNYSYTFDASGTYDMVFTFNPTTEEVGFTATLTQQGEEVDPVTGKLYILGQVNDNNWNPSTGIEMSTTDEDVYTLADATFTDSGDGYAYFSFTSKLGENENDWSFGDYRRGAESDGYEITDEMLGTKVTLADWGSTDAFKVAAGVYDVTVYLSSDKVVLTKKETETHYFQGDVNHDQDVNISDVTAIIDRVLANKTIEGVCDYCSDVNGDGDINISDVTALIDLVLNSTVNPYPWR